jgi:uncharacterized membrane protein YfcA
MTEQLLILCGIALITGLINGSVGGGGLLQLPGTLSVLPNEKPATILGINKFAAVFGNGSAALEYLRHIPLSFALLVPALACAVVGAFAGALTSSYIPASWFKPFIFVMLIVITIYTFLKKEFGKQQNKELVVTRGLRIGACVLGFVAGFYDGSFGPGVGNLMAFCFVRFFALDFMRAVAHARVINFMTNLSSLTFFIPTGHIIWFFAVPMAVCNLIGGFIGVQIVLKGGIPVIRVLFLVIMLALIVKMGVELFL